MRYKQGCEPVGVSLVYKSTCCMCDNEATKHIYDRTEFYDSDKFPNLPNGKRYCYKHLQDEYANAYIYNKNNTISITCDLAGNVEESTKSGLISTQAKNDTTVAPVQDSLKLTTFKY